jgi:positive regulator of sigma E activity
MTQVQNMVDLETAVEEALPPELAPLAGIVADRLRPRIEARLATFIESDTFNRIWVAVNTRVHDAIVRILRGESNRVVTGANGEVSLNLVPLVYQALTFLQEHASFALRGHTVPVGVDPVSDPAAAVQALSTEFGRSLPADFAQPVVFTSERLAAAQQAVHLFDVAFVVALLLPLVLIAITILLAKRRRRRTLQLVVGGLLALVLAQVAIKRIQESVVVAIKEPGNRRAVAEVVGAVTHGLNVLIAACLITAVVVGVVAYFLGRPAWFMRLLGAGRRAMTSRRALDAQAYAADHAIEFMWGGVAVAVIVWWFVGLSWVSLAIVGGLLIGWLALVEYVRRRGAATHDQTVAPSEAAGHPA